MTTIFDPSLAAMRHQELLRQRELDRRIAVVRREQKARRLNRRAAVLARRAAALVEQTHR